MSISASNHGGGERTLHLGSGQRTGTPSTTADRHALTDFGVEVVEVVEVQRWTRHQFDTAGRNSAEFSDIKTDKFHAIGPASWRTALSYSPAEPGLSRALELPGGTVSAGGWSELHPTLVLRNMGCDNVVYVTRTDIEVGGFADGVATLLGMDDDSRTKLYDLDADSSITNSIDDADAVS